MTETINHEGFYPPQGPEVTPLMSELHPLSESIRSNNVPSFEEFLAARQVAANLPEPNAEGKYVVTGGAHDGEELDTETVERIKENTSPDAWRLDETELDDINKLDDVTFPTDENFPQGLIDDFSGFLDDYPKGTGTPLADVFKNYKEFKHKEEALNNAIFDAQEAGELPPTVFPDEGEAAEQTEVPVPAPEASTPEPKQDHKDWRKGAADDRKVRGDRPRAARGNKKGADSSTTPSPSPKESAYDTADKSTIDAEIVDDLPAAASAAPKPGLKATARRSTHKSSNGVDTSESTPVNADAQPLPKDQARKFTARLKGIFNAVATSPQRAYSRVAFGMGDADPLAYAARRERRTTLVRGAVGAAVITKLALNGYMAYKGMGGAGNIGHSFADLLPGTHGAGQGGGDLLHQANVPPPEAADLMQHAESLSNNGHGAGFHDNITNHINQIAAAHGIDPSDPRVGAAIERTVAVNGLGGGADRHMRVGQQFTVPDLSDLLGSSQPGPSNVEHVGFIGDTYSQHAVDQLHHEGILDPTAKQVTDETQNFLHANHQTWDSAKHIHVGDRIINPDIDAGPRHPVVTPIPEMHAPVAVHQVGVPRAEILDSGAWMAAGIGSIAAHEELERILQQMHDSDVKTLEEDEAAEGGLWKTSRKKSRTTRPASTHGSNRPANRSNQRVSKQANRKPAGRHRA